MHEIESIQFSNKTNDDLASTGDFLVEYSGVGDDGVFG